MSPRDGAAFFLWMMSLMGFGLRCGCCYGGLDSGS